MRAVVFDFGGVLIDWNPRHLYRKLFATEAEMEGFFAEVDFGSWNVQLDRGLPFREGVATLSGRFPRHAHHIAAFADRWEESISGPIDETVEIARELRAHGYPLYAISNWSAETFHHVEYKYDFLRWFREIVISGRVGVCKPEPGIYGRLLERIPVPAPECVFIDDVPANVAGAEAVGMKGIHFRSARQLRADLARIGVRLARAPAGR